MSVWLHVPAWYTSHLPKQIIKFITQKKEPQPTNGNKLTVQVGVIKNERKAQGVRQVLVRWLFVFVTIHYEFTRQYLILQVCLQGRISLLEDCISVWLYAHISGAGIA